jgi:hypothetical protein
MDDADKLKKALALVDEQANDGGLWFIAEYASEAYLQDALRKLHTILEEERGLPPLPPLANRGSCQ